MRVLATTNNREGVHAPDQWQAASVREAGGVIYHQYWIGTRHGRADGGPFKARDILKTPKDVLSISWLEDGALDAVLEAVIAAYPFDTESERA